MKFILKKYNLFKVYLLCPTLILKYVQIKYMMIKYILWLIAAILIVNVIVSLICGHLSTYYNDSIRSTYSGFDASVLGILMIILIFTMNKYPYPNKIVNFVVGFLMGLGLLGLIFQFALGFYFGGWACAMWLIISGVMIYGNKIQFFQMRPTNQKENSPQNTSQVGYANSLISFEQNNGQSENNADQKAKSCCNKQKCGYCCHACCLITSLILMTLFVIMSIVYFANLSQYPVFGQLFPIQNEVGQVYKIHAFCIGNEHATRPTIILEHGGGSNSMAFADLGSKLSSVGWKMCTYDRLGYGRSSVVHRGLSIQKRAQITEKVITKLLQNQINKNIIIGGWSAGVELSQIYRKIYSANVRGMIFMDGYPDYISLMAIYDKKSEVVPYNVASLTGVIRILQPFGLGLIVGNNLIPNSTINQYYKAYYQTGYFWESQYMDVVNPFSTTSWLTQSAGSDPKPYPDSKINLNWPDIDVPLLVMPANGTVSIGDYSKMYIEQSQKYIDKCTSPNKNLMIIQGDHGYVLEHSEVVATKIDQFFKPFF